MEATSAKLLSYLLAVGAIFSIGCAQYGVTSTNESCASSAKSDSFLVKWKGAVPAEYAAYKLNPQSLMTRFSGMSQSEVEKQILYKHQDEFEIAEHDFTLNAIDDEELDSTRANSIPTKRTASAPVTVWGPQDIQLQQAWASLGEQGNSTIVAVVDSGIDYNHPLLQGQIWVNDKEIPNNGIDDDKNGFVDDYMGYDFTQNGSNVYDTDSHGTHVSGIIAGLPQSSVGFTGVAPTAKIMPLKFIDSSGSGAASNAIRAIDYAVANGAKVINASWGGGNCSNVLQSVIQSAVQSGTVFVSAAGNDGMNLAVAQEWPAIYQLPGKITVGSYNQSDVFSYFSNYGTLVDLAGPGENIISTVPPVTSGGAEGQLQDKSGTSMATPFVTGVAALLLGARPGALPADIVAAINAGVAYQGYNVRTAGKLSALSAATYFMSHSK